MRMLPSANLSLVLLSFTTLTAGGCQSERTDVGGSASGQAAAGQTTAAQSGSGGNDGSGGGGGAPGSGGGATGAGGDLAGSGGGATALAEACDAYCAATADLPCSPDDCGGLCPEVAPGCKSELAALLSCAVLDLDNFTCSGDQVQISPTGCPDEYAALDACL